MFGDYEPEDAWDALDTPLEQARNLGRRIALVDDLDAPRGTSSRALLAAVRHRYELALGRRNLTDRDRLRLEQIADDLAYAWERSS